MTEERKAILIAEIRGWFADKSPSLDQVIEELIRSKVLLQESIEYVDEAKSAAGDWSWIGRPLRETVAELREVAERRAPRSQPDFGNLAESVIAEDNDQQRYDAMMRQLKRLWSAGWAARDAAEAERDNAADEADRIAKARHAEQLDEWQKRVTVVLEPMLKRLDQVESMGESMRSAQHNALRLELASHFMPDLAGHLIEDRVITCAFDNADRMINHAATNKAMPDAVAILGALVTVLDEQQRWRTDPTFGDLIGKHLVKARELLIKEGHPAGRG